MQWALILALVVVLVFLSFSAREQVPWARKLKRIHAGVAYRAEWMAPDETVAQVQQDYLATVEWLRASILNSGTTIHAASYLSGNYLKRYETLYARTGGIFIGVLLAKHHIQVRHFAEDGLSCLVIDCQTERRMLTYERQAGLLMGRQDIGDGAVVYRMAYDRLQRRWKLDAFIQELPAGWGGWQSSGQVQLLSSLPGITGRDY